MSGELISIEDTYKEVNMYKKSGGNNDMLTNAVATSSSVPNMGVAPRMNNNNQFEEMK